MRALEDAVEGNEGRLNDLLNSGPPRVWAPTRLDHFCAVDRVTRVAEIADGDQLAAIPLQQDEIARPPLRHPRIEHQNRWSSFDQAGDEPPVVDRRIVAEIS